MSAGTFATGNGTLTYTITGTPASSGIASFILEIGGQSCVLTRMVSQGNGTITNLNCGAATHIGILTQGVVASGVSSQVPYTGGNGGSYNGQMLSSTGVTGLTATLSAGTFATGNGTLTYTITGTPASSGIASFSLNIGGQTCNLTCVVNSGLVTSLNCTGATQNGTLVHGNQASGISSVVPYTGGNGGPYSGQFVNSTGVNGLTATLSAGIFAIGNGTLTYEITGTPDSSGTASFALNIGGQSCTLSRLVNPGLITALNCSAATNNGTLTQGTAATGVNSLVPCTGGNGGPHNGQVVNSTGVTGLTATLTADTFAIGNDTLVFTITGTPTGSGTASFALNIGGQSCTLTRVVNTGLIASLNCGGATHNGTLLYGVPATGVSSEVSYTGGNGGSHNGQVVNSTGVTGLTATLVAGTFASGSGTLMYMITGTPSNSGAASFALNIGGQTCTLTRNVNANYIPGTVHCNDLPSAIVDVLNPNTGRTWMDRNLGASQKATSSADTASYGDLYQWGRRADGHHCRNSVLTTVLSNSDQPPHGNFILAQTNPFDWRSPQNANLWQGVNGINNPCPSGYRLPTEAELNAERSSWSSNNAAGAFASPLKFSKAGYRNFSNGSLDDVGNYGLYWSSTVSNNFSRGLFFNSSSASMFTGYRAAGNSVRCLKD